MIIGIYKITNKINNKIYIGSSINIKQRWKKHKTELNNRKHHSKHLENAWHLYGSKNFEFSIIEETKDELTLLEKEQYYLDLYKPFLEENGYNVCSFADSVIGVTRSEEERIKLSKHFNKNSCINFEIAEQIRIKYSSGLYSHRKLAVEYNTSKTTIKEIIYFKRWNLNNVPISTERNAKKVNSGKSKLSQEQIKEVILLRQQAKLTLNQIANNFNVDIGVIVRIMNKHKREKQ